VNSKYLQIVQKPGSEIEREETANGGDQLFDLQSCLLSLKQTKLPFAWFDGHLKIHSGEKSNQVSSC